MTEELTFKQELRVLINKHSLENASDTPDYILMEYIMDCLNAWTLAVQLRDRWYRRTDDD